MCIHYCTDCFNSYKPFCKIMYTYAIWFWLEVILVPFMCQLHDVVKPSVKATNCQITSANQFADLSAVSNWGVTEVHDTDDLHLTRSELPCVFLSLKEKKVTEVLQYILYLFYKHYYWISTQQFWYSLWNIDRIYLKQSKYKST